MTYRVRNIGIAVALAVVAALLTTFYVTNYKRNVQQSEEKVAVYVAARDIPLGTSGSDVASGGSRLSFQPECDRRLRVDLGHGVREAVGAGILPVLETPGGAYPEQLHLIRVGCDVPQIDPDGVVVDL